MPWRRARLDDDALLGRLFRDVSRISSGDRVPADAQDLHPHLESIFDRIELRTLVMRPRHRNFGDRESAAACQIDKLGIESPALDQLPREDGFSGAAGEGLEAAANELPEE